ncbi:LLM class flavin-dependent oxidoreductase [Cohnella hashimotonis]|uniref:LLM class flavin-dependent oxidoreductase n=1 Tax=Cohnella hashimotonis TaxID=2826895 RepID=A0ABT6TJB1_9BACL|nr:LLM class flavin-dependent oxidoreductase [Cohnella hashimotonis]MDI4646814.1 LLM class flavin-dependent oxidoreductase [Cohnella hashimotonis]
MKLSILDQAPVVAGQTPGDALRSSALLAQAGERFGYSRYWLAEHHGLGGLACSTPEVMLGMIGAMTSRIRIGAGAILLPYYKPYKVAETFRLLAALFPGRIDLGVARSPGGPAEISMALSDNYLERALRMPDDFAALVGYLNGEKPGTQEPGLGQKFRAEAEAEAGSGLGLGSRSAGTLGTSGDGPAPWVLGTSGKSASLAAAYGTGYAYGYFMNRENAAEAIATYRKSFDRSRGERPYVVLAVSAVCADSQPRAEEIARSVRAWRLLSGQGRGEAGIPGPDEAALLLGASGPAGPDEPGLANAMIVGGPAQVRDRLSELRETYGADELMIVSYAHDFADRVRSYELIMEACGD